MKRNGIEDSPALAFINRGLAGAAAIGTGDATGAGSRGGESNGTDGESNGAGNGADDRGRELADGRGNVDVGAGATEADEKPVTIHVEINGGAGPVRTQGRKGRKKPRINLAFESAAFLASVRECAEAEGKSVTQFINDAAAYYIRSKHKRLRRSQ